MQGSSYRNHEGYSDPTAGAVIEGISRSKILKAYVADFSEDAFIAEFMRQEGITTKAEAISALRRRIPKEGWYQAKVRDGIKARYKNVYTAKIAQGSYSTGGIPDLMVIYKGHYFGFEIKRPIVGELSPIQKATIKAIRDAGGTAEVIVWPEQAYKILDAYGKEKNGNDD